MAASGSNSFTMVSTRAAIATGLTHVERQVSALESAIDENAGLVFDLSRALVESACRTILADRNVAFQTADDLPQLFRSVTNSIPMLPESESHESDIRQSVRKTLSGLQTSIIGLCELRNHCGFASHGTHGPRPALEGLHARMAAESADAIVGFLYQMHVQDLNRERKHVISYDEHGDFNDEIDETHEIIDILGSIFRPSEVLFQMEPDTYNAYLVDYGDVVNNPDEDVQHST